MKAPVATKTAARPTSEWKAATSWGIAVILILTAMGHRPSGAWPPPTMGLTSGGAAGAPAWAMGARTPAPSVTAATVARDKRAGRGTVRWRIDDSCG